MSTPESIVRARLELPAGPLARPLAHRFVMALGVQTALPVDRVQEAAMAAETIVHLYTTHTSARAVELTVRAEPDRLHLRFSGLGPDGAIRLLAADASGSPPDVLRTLSSALDVSSGSSGDQALVLVVAAA